MATIATALAVAPIAINAFQVAVPLVEQLIQTFENLLGKGKGAEKKAAVVSATAVSLDQTMKAGITTPTPSMPELEALAETLFQKMKSDGRLISNPTNIPITTPVVAPAPANKTLVTALLQAALELSK